MFLPHTGVGQRFIKQERALYILISFRSFFSDVISLCKAMRRRFYLRESPGADIIGTSAWKDTKEQCVSWRRMFQVSQDNWAVLFIIPLSLPLKATFPRVETHLCTWHWPISAFLQLGSPIKYEFEQNKLILSSPQRLNHVTNTYCWWHNCWRNNF